jgi:hypothetical protein
MNANELWVWVYDPLLVAALAGLGGSFSSKRL